MTNYTVGNYLTPNSGVLVTIVKVQPIRVRFSVSTGDYLKGFGSLKNMQETAIVKVRLSDGKTYPVDGKVKFLNNEANSRTDAIQVFAEFPNDDMRLLNGSTVAVTLSRKVSRKVPAVPLSAVVYDAKGACVYVVSKDPAKNAFVARKQYFVPSGANGEYQFVKSGLKVGETIISAGTHKIMVDGMPVQISKEAGK